MEEINRKILIGERALFQKEDLLINECIFEDGESPLKESKNIIKIIYGVPFLIILVGYIVWRIRRNKK